jgi:transposase-like protein
VLTELSKVEQRYDEVMAVVRDGMTVTEVAQAFGVSRQSVYAWMARYERGGLDALAERSHRPRIRHGFGRKCDPANRYSGEVQQPECSHRADTDTRPRSRRNSWHMR